MFQRLTRSFDQRQGMLTLGRIQTHLMGTFRNTNELAVKVPEHFDIRISVSYLEHSEARSTRNIAGDKNPGVGARIDKIH